MRPAFLNIIILPSILFQTNIVCAYFRSKAILGPKVTKVQDGPSTWGSSQIQHHITTLPPKNVVSSLIAKKKQHIKSNKEKSSNMNMMAALINKINESSKLRDRNLFERVSLLEKGLEKIEDKLSQTLEEVTGILMFEKANAQKSFQESTTRGPYSRPATKTTVGALSRGGPRFSRPINGNNRSGQSKNSNFIKIED